jgi:hypothetical protein
MQKVLKAEIVREDLHPSQALVAHTCNPGYLEGKNQEDCSSKPT